MQEGVREEAIESFLAQTRWDEYAGATIAFAALRDGAALPNLACRIVLRKAPPEGWDFEDEIDGLVIRRAWVPGAEVRTTLAGLHDDRLILGNEALSLLRDGNGSYAWTRLLPGHRSRKVIGWSAQSLFGLGENQYLFLGYEAFTRLGSSLRAASQRPFDGWPNVAAFLGEGEEPLGLGEQHNTNLECFAPLYARIEPGSTLGMDGTLKVLVSCIAPQPHKPQLLLGSVGPDAPRSLELLRDRADDIWRSTTTLSPAPDRAALTLMLGKEVADQAVLVSEPTRIQSRIEESQEQLTALGTGGQLPPSGSDATPPTLVERWKRRAANQPVLAGLIILAAAVIAIGGVARPVMEVRDLFVHQQTAEAPTPQAPPMATQAPKISRRLLQVVSRLKSYDYFRADTASSMEAASMLRAAGLERISVARDPLGPVTAQVDEVWCITLWPQSYGHPNAYGVRYGPCSSQFKWDSQKTYFEVVIPAHSLP